MALLNGAGRFLSALHQVFVLQNKSTQMPASGKSIYAG
ncbi:hypothetical protein SAMCFNEI73_Ch1792 [Sinorhizobium americanum]|uniref:Uncharacterized protein n=1 Tax=Sinorhizobium americanum TaxID=194963 RepID=A0A1L3LLY6_9HYPH|nr:hypothetical protein SAMCFNEI73_Ch1792 [Sinorhizobium americanum]